MTLFPSQEPSDARCTVPEIIWLQRLLRISRPLFLLCYCGRPGDGGTATGRSLRAVSDASIQLLHWVFLTVPRCTVSQSRDGGTAARLRGDAVRCSVFGPRANGRCSVPENGQRQTRQTPSNSGKAVYRALTGLITNVNPRKLFCISRTYFTYAIT